MRGPAVSHTPELERGVGGAIAGLSATGRTAEATCDVSEIKEWGRAVGGRLACACARHVRRVIGCGDGREIASMLLVLQ